MTNQQTSTATPWQKAKVILIGGTLHLLKFIGHGIVYLRSGRKPVLVMKMPRTATQQDYISAVVSVQRDRAINRDYHVFILKGNTNADFTHEVFAGKFKKKDIEELKKMILANILDKKVNDDRKRMEFARISHGNKHHSKGSQLKRV